MTAVDRTPVSYAPQREWFVREVKYGEDADAKRDYFTFIVYPPGTFQMGSPDHETGHFSDEVRHDVTLTYTIAVCDREVTNAQYARFRAVDEARGAPEPAKDDHPVVNVSWNDAVQYCQWLTGRDPKLKPCYVPVQKETNASAEPTPAAADAAAEAPNLSFELVKDWQFRDGFRLPTEAEWEYACRAGTITPFSCGSDDDLLKNYARFSADSTVRCGELRPNLRGLFDMHGNVREWCWDGMEDYAADAATDPTGPKMATRPGVPRRRLGVSAPSSAGRRIAARSGRRTATGTWAFAWPQFRSEGQDRNQSTGKRSLERRPKGERAQRAEPIPLRAVAEGGARWRRQEKAVGGAAAVGSGAKPRRAARALVVFLVVSHTNFADEPEFPGS